MTVKKVIILKLMLAFGCMTLPFAAHVMEVDARSSAQPMKKCTLKIGDYYAMPAKHQWLGRWNVKFQIKKPKPIWIVTNVVDNSRDRCYKLEYEDSYSKFEIIQLKQEESAAKPSVSSKTLFVASAEGLTLPLLTDCLQSVFSIKRMWLK